MDREVVMTALLEMVTSAAGFVTTGRELLYWDEVPNQPAVYVVDAEEELPGVAYNMPRASTMSAEIWIYTKGTERGDKNRAKALNALLDAVETVLQPDPVTDVQTLGGVVENAWIEGRIDKSPGHVGKQAVAVIPVVMIVPR